MKKIFFFTLLIPMIIISCESDPRASFLTDTVEPEVGQKVFFDNTSENATRFEWDFGDGTLSYEKDPVHTYISTGSFEVKLTAISKNGLEDKAFLDIDVMIPTLLEIEVLEYYDEYPVAGASVILYSTVTDWDAASNSICEGFTDADGIVVFSGLDPFVHYVDVYEQNHDNWGLRNEDIGFIRTPEVLPHKINRFIAWVDYVEHAKGVVKGERKLVIRKLERKYDSKKQADSFAGTQDWQELYKRSIGKKQ